MLMFFSSVFGFSKPYVRCVVKRMPGSICLQSTIHGFLSETRKKSYKYEKQILGAFAVNDGGMAEGHKAKIYHDFRISLVFDISLPRLEEKRFC